MSKQVDEKVVSMQFDNKNFESNVQTSLSTLDKLKNSLKLSNASKGLENIDATVKGMDINPLSKAVETVGMKFNAMQIMATTALVNITNSAVNAGKRIVSAFTIDPVKTGLQEYETQINAVQTILANTSSKGTTLEQVNNALDELNHYADMTIYNFTEMTRNIGTFTAAGVDLDTSVSAIKGIANLAAVSGSTSLQASTAMYQLSQALAAGKVQLMDWNSVVNAGMGGQVFQDALKETARVDGIAIDDMIEKHGSFRETLQEGWLTSEVLTKTLAKFTGDLSEAQLKEMGYTEEQIKEIIKLGQTANDAATKVKTFTQLMDTLKEAAQSGWTQTWEILIGDFEQAKSLWTDVSDYFSEALNKSAEARNNMLEGWAKGGGREMAIESFKNAFQGLLSVIKPIKEAFREIFPATTADKLLNITKSIRDFTAKLKLSETASANLKATFKGFFALIDIGVTIIKKIVGAVAQLFTGVDKVGGGILSATGALGNYIVGLRDSIKESNTFGDALTHVADILKNIFGRLIEVIGYINKKLVAPGFKWFYSLLMGIWNVLKWIGSKVKTVLSSIADGLKEAFQNGDLANVTTVLGGGVFVAILLKLKKFISGFTDSFGGFKDIFKGVTDVLESVGDALKAWQQELQAKTLLKIAGAIAILAASILIISTIDKERLVAALGAITMLFAELMAAMAIFAKIAGIITGVLKASIAMIAMSTSVLILAGALKTIASIKTEDLIKSLLGLGAVFAILLEVLKRMSKIDMTGNGVGKLIVIAASLVIFASALKILSTMSWEEMGVGLISMLSTFAILLGSLALMALINKKLGEVGKGAASLVAMSVSLVLVASALKIVGTMDWDSIWRGLAGLGIALYGLVGAVALMALINKKLGKGSAASILVLANSLILIATALKIVGSMDLASVGIALLGLGVALVVITGVIAALGAVGPMALVGAASILIVSTAIAILAASLIALSLVSAENLTGVLNALADGFWKLGLAGVVLLLGIPAITALAIALPLIGIGALAVGAGLLAIGAGLTALAVASTANAAAIVATLTIIIQGIIGLIPMILVAIGNGIIAIVNIIAKSGKAIFDAVKTILVAVGNAIIESAPTIVKAVFVLLEALLNGIVNFVPKLVDAGIKLIVGLLNGIASRIGEVIQAGVNTVVAFIKGFSSAIPQLVDAGFKAMIDLLNGLADSIRTNTPLVIEAVNNLLSACIEAIGMYIGNFAECGVQLMKGLATGIWNGVKLVVDSVINAVETVWNAAMNWLGIHSPSTKGIEAGMYIDEGLAVGLSKYADTAGDAATDVGKETVNSLSDALSGVSDVIENDMDVQPTIRPVLDLSEVESGVSKVDDLFGFNPAISALSKANTIGSSADKNQNGAYDVVSAIKELSKKIANGTGNVYNVNGITYDDGSAVADAVGSLVRAARIERRI